MIRTPYLQETTFQKIANRVRMLKLLAILTFLCAVNNVNPCSSPVVDLGILIEGSSSFGKSEYILTQRVLVSLVQRLDVSTSQTHVGIGYYSNRPYLHAELRDDRLYDPVKLMLSILSLPFPGGKEARTDLALKMADEKLFAVDKGDRNGVPKVLIVVIHGRPGPRNTVYKEALKQLKDRGTRIIAVGVAEGAGDNDLLEIALGKKERVFRVKDIEELNVGQLSTMIKNSC